MKKNYPLFLPNVTKTFANFESKLIDSEVRLHESRQALFSIIKKNYFKEIVLVDGSNTPILSVDEILDFMSKGIRIEQLVFQQDITLVENYGKGNGEMQITNFMTKHSELVKRAGGFVKLTPRYYFDNIDEVFPIVNEYDNVFFFYYPEPVRNIKKFVMSIFYKTSLDFYNRNLKDSIVYHNKEVSGYMESVLYRQLRYLPKKSIYVSYPHFSGTSGTTGKSIQNQYVIFRNICSKIGTMAYSFK